MISDSHRRRLASILAATALVLAQDMHAFAQSRCLTPPEKTAFEIRMLQTELMVATLTCRGVPGRDYSKQYADFVTTHRDGLKRHSEVFQGHFKRGGGATQMDRYVTSLANNYSQASMTGTGAFCDRQGAVFERAATLQPPDLTRFAAERAEGHSIGVPLCRSTDQASPAKKK